MDKNYKPVYVHGTKSGKGVIEALIAHGGINNCDYKGNCESNIYYIAPNTNFICGVDEYSQFAPYVIATAKEIKPLKWRAEQGGGYYTIGNTIEIMKMYDVRDCFDNKRYENGNYFRTEAEAIEMLKKVKKTLSNE